MRNFKLVTLSRDYEKYVKVRELKSGIKQGKKYN